MFAFVLRSHAIACVNQFIIGRAQALMDNIDTFIEVSLETLFWLEALIRQSAPVPPVGSQYWTTKM